jgi:hypothetical protein
VKLFSGIVMAMAVFAMRGEVLFAAEVVACQEPTIQQDTWCDNGNINGHVNCPIWETLFCDSDTDGWACCTQDPELTCECRPWTS